MVAWIDRLAEVDPHGQPQHQRYIHCGLIGCGEVVDRDVEIVMVNVHRRETTSCRDSRDAVPTDTDAIFRHVPMGGRPSHMGSTATGIDGQLRERKPPRVWHRRTMCLTSKRNNTWHASISPQLIPSLSSRPRRSLQARCPATGFSFYARHVWTQQPLV